MTHILIRTLLLITMTFLSVAAARAQSRASGAAATATISGRVTLDGAGAPGVHVMLKPGAGDDGVSHSCGSAQAPTIKTITDAEGRYRLTGVSPGSCSISVFAPAFVIADEGFFFRRGKTVNVAEGENVENVDFALTRGAVITGVVTQEKDGPVVECTIIAYKLDAKGEIEYPDPDQARRDTDDRGVYRLFGLEPGRYVVAAFSGPARTFHPDAAEQARARIVEVKSGEEAANIDIKVAPPVKGYVVTGRVVEADTGKPVPGIEVRCDATTQSATRWWGSVESDSLGRFRFENVPPNSYNAFTESEQGGALALGDEITFDVVAGDVSDLEIRMPHGAIISGIVAIEGSNVPSLRAKLARANLIAQGDSGSGTSIIRPNGNGAVSPNGTFKLSNVKPGKTRITMGPGSPNGFALLRVEHNGVEVDEFNVNAGDQIAGVRLVFAYGAGVITGRIEVKGEPPPDLRLRVEAYREGGVPDESPVNGAWVDGRRRFVLEGLAPGTYKLVLNSYRSTSLLKMFPTIQDRQTLTIAGEGRHEITLVVDLTAKEKEK
jgi:protocatechuate 3,4-dioxygenase beta subunit